MATIAQRTAARFLKSVTALEKALALSPLAENADRDAVLLRFELAAELMPKDAVRAARRAELVNEGDAETLLSTIDDRNRIVHDYSEEYAAALLQKVRTSYAPALRTLADKLQ